MVKFRNLEVLQILSFTAVSSNLCNLLTVLDCAGSPAYAALFDMDGLERAYKVLQQTCERRCAFPFTEPVNTDIWQGYLEIVTKPMDLGTVMFDIKTGVYKHPGRVARD